MTTNDFDQGSDLAISDSSTVSPQVLAVMLSGQQRALLRALERRDEGLSVMYIGALTVLNETSNLDRFAQSAHSLRELMEKLPRLLDVPLEAQKENLKSKVREIENAYLNTQKQTHCFTVMNGWDGYIDGHLRKFLSDLKGFFDWFGSHHPRRRDEFHHFLTCLDGSGRDLPKPLASLNVDDWDKKRDFFQSVAHHRKIVNEQEFLQCMDALERFLLDRLEPRTFDDFAEIDALIEEGGNNAK